jgi:hypothetical protein
MPDFTVHTTTKETVRDKFETDYGKRYGYTEFWPSWSGAYCADHMQNAFIGYCLALGIEPSEVN